MSSQTRTEYDSMGGIEVPADALWGASTQRALQHFNISGQPVRTELIQAYGQIKRAAALANQHLELLEPRLGEAIVAAATAIAEGEHAQHFPVDTLQTGSGTSTNMNVNEVVANLANLALGGALGSKNPVHPNDHVNLGQSSNDTFPSAIHIAAVIACRETLEPALAGLRNTLITHERKWMHVIKLGRTHLMDATPVRMGQVFQGFAGQIEMAQARVELVTDSLLSLALGGTAVGTGINAHPEFARQSCLELAAATGHGFTETQHHFAAQASQDLCVAASGTLHSIAVALSRIANDIRWMASGPRSGLGELVLPAIQPGSSIMPGKVNPVICEAVIQACVRVAANHAAIGHGAFGGVGANLELNVALPLIADHLLESIQLLSRSCDSLREHVLEGLEVDEAQCKAHVERSLMLVTSLVPEIGYDKAAAIAKTALANGQTLREVILAEKLIDPEELDQLLDPERAV
jgi:fumarate hydratase class II